MALVTREIPAKFIWNLVREYDNSNNTGKLALSGSGL
jgi:hypothetical protein